MAYTGAEKLVHWWSIRVPVLVKQKLTKYPCQRLVSPHVKRTWLVEEIVLTKSKSLLGLLLSLLCKQQPVSDKDKGTHQPDLPLKALAADPAAPSVSQCGPLFASLGTP